MTLQVETTKLVKIVEGSDERLRLTFDEDGDLVITQNDQSFYLPGYLADEFRNGVAKLFSGRPVKRTRSHVVD